MTELLTASGFQSLTPDLLKTQQGVEVLNSMIRTLFMNMVKSDKMKIYFGYGAPENNVAAGIGSLYLRLDGGSSTTLYVKESGTADTGWIAK